MYTAEYEVKVQLGADQVWEKLRDISCADQYVPGLTGLDITTVAREGVGASRTVYQGSRLALSETVTEWREREGFTLRLHRGDKGPMPPLTEAWFDYGMEERDGAVYLRNRMRYRIGLGPLGRLLHSLLIARVIKSALRDATLAQKLYYESGKPVTPELLKAAKAELSDQ